MGADRVAKLYEKRAIEIAHQLGKPIIGVYENGLKEKVELPENLKKYATSIVAWRADSVIDALDRERSVPKS